MNRNELYNKIGKYIYLEDTTVLDVLFAFFLANKDINGVRLWLFLLADSGGLKTSLLEPFSQFKDYVIIDDDINPASIVSGNPNCTTDLYSKLESNDPKLQIDYDFSVMSSKRADEKRLVMSKYKNLYDGSLYRRTANRNVGKENLKLGFIAGITHTIINDKIIFNSNAFGTRQLTYEIIIKDQDKVADMCQQNDGEEDVIKGKLKKYYLDFLKGKTFQRISPHADIKKWIKQKVKEMTILRGSGTLDRYGNHYTSVSKESVSRLNKQFSRLYSALRTVDDNYPDNKYKKVIENMIRSSAEKTRYEIWQVIKNRPNNIFYVKDFYNDYNIRKNHVIISRELDFLWQLKILDMKEQEELVCGRTRLVRHYWLSDFGK